LQKVLVELEKTWPPQTQKLLHQQSIQTSVAKKTVDHTGNTNPSFSNVNPSKRPSFKDFIKTQQQQQYQQPQVQQPQQPQEQQYQVDGCDDVKVESSTEGFSQADLTPSNKVIPTMLRISNLT
jgi:hypothetical protein